MSTSEPATSHPLTQARRGRNLTQRQAAEKAGIGLNTLKRAEHGEPVSLETCRRLTHLFECNTEELGLVKEEPSVFQFVSRSVQKEAPAAIWIPSQARLSLPDSLSEQEMGAWLIINACHLTETGLPLESLLDVFPVILKVVQTMPKMSRRRLIQLAATAFVLGDVPLPPADHVSAEQRVQLHSSLGENIAAGWKLFHTAGNEQVLAVSYAQLYLLQQVSAELYPSVRPLLYSSVYNLIGAAKHFQGHYDEAYQAHERAYIGALEGMDVLSMAQSRTWQANGLREQRRYSEALQVFDAAFRLISSRSDIESVRLQAHLLAAEAESAAFLGEFKLVQKHLAASESLLEHLPTTHVEEFDHASWHQYAGTCALILEQYDYAVEELQYAIQTLPPNWLMRHATALMPLAIAYARAGEREKCLEIVEKAAQVIQEMHAPSLNQQFVGYLEQEIQVAFPGDLSISTSTARIRQQIMASMNALTLIN
jgi:tetratricopeptide (TPR) repeat protein/DNA-binding XRE family transcriptional regulator